ERQPGEELGSHASALASVELAARRARAGRLGLTQLVEELALAPHAGEPARVAHVAGEELVVDHERAGVHVADRVDQTHHPSGAAQVQSRQCLARATERVQMEERVTGQYRALGV